MVGTGGALLRCEGLAEDGLGLVGPPQLPADETRVREDLRPLGVVHGPQLEADPGGPAGEPPRLVELALPPEGFGESVEAPGAIGIVGQFDAVFDVHALAQDLLRL